MNSMKNVFSPICHDLKLVSAWILTEVSHSVSEHNSTTELHTSEMPCINRDLTEESRTVQIKYQDLPDIAQVSP